MKTNILKVALGSMLVLTGLSSCEFDQYPDTSIPSEKAWAKVSDAEQFNNGLSSAVRSICGGAYAEISELQSDLFNETTANWGGGSYGNVQNWNFTSASFSGDAVWSGCYTVISNANNIINNIDKVACDNASDSANVAYYKGCAYFARALAYDKLARRYCKAYDSATADQQLGLPLVSVVDVNAKPSRASLKETYEFIKSDVAQAKALMPADGSRITENYDISYDAADALDARVSLNCQDYDHAIECAQRVVAKYPLVDKDDLENMWANDEGSEIIYQPIQTINERTNSYGCYIMYDSNKGMLSPDNVPTQGLIDLYEDDDARLYAYFNGEDGAVAGEIVAENVITFKKYPGNPSLVKSNPYSEYYNMTKELRSGEMYLIAAEASYMKDGSGLDFLNTLRTARGASALNVEGTALFSQIKDEWAREMCGEGFRLDCLKRWGMGCKRLKAQTVTDGYLQSQTRYQDLDVPATDKHFVWEIPVNDTQANPNLKHNWDE